MQKASPAIPSSAVPLVAPRAPFSYVDDKFPARLTCPICTDPLVDPVRTPCKHLFCKECLARVTALLSPACPSCRAALPAGVQLTGGDETLLELLGDLEVYCSNKARGCAWKGPRANLSEHLTRNCELMLCPQFRAGCQATGKWSALQVHQSSCEYAVDACALGCGFRAERRLLLASHLPQCPVLLAREEEARKKAEEEGRRQRELAEQQEKRERELRSLYDALNPSIDQVIWLSVGGRPFAVSRRALCKEPDSLLAGLFSSNRALQTDAAGAVLLDLDPDAFGHIVTWLRTDVIPAGLSPDALAVLQATAKQLRLNALGASLSRPASAIPTKITHKDLALLVTLSKTQGWSGTIPLMGACLAGLDLTGFDFSSFNLCGADLSRCDLTGAKLRANAHGQALNLCRVNFCDAILTSADFTYANLAEANMTNANLSRAMLVGAYLPKANLTGANLEHANLSQANLENTNLTDTSLASANMYSAKTSTTIVTNARIKKSISVSWTPAQLAAARPEP